MAKRFYDSRKYQDPWLRKLPPNYKLLWDYMLCVCNHAGFWKVDFEMAIFCIGLDVEQKEALKVFGGKRVWIVDAETWFIPKFIEFQYGELNEAVNCHKSVIFELKKERVYEQFINSCPTVKDKDKDKDKDRDKVRLNKSNIYNNNSKYKPKTPPGYGPKGIPQSVKDIIAAKGKA